jgi:hypothetical protein
MVRIIQHSRSLRRKQITLAGLNRSTALVNNHQPALSGISNLDYALKSNSRTWSDRSPARKFTMFATETESFSGKGCVRFSSPFIFTLFSAPRAFDPSNAFISES